jgi:hypothetical protein
VQSRQTKSAITAPACWRAAQRSGSCASCTLVARTCSTGGQGAAVGAAQPIAGAEDVRCAGSFSG